MKRASRGHLRWSSALGAVLALAAVAGIGAMIGDSTIVGRLHVPNAVHVDQANLLAMVQAGQGHEAYETAFDMGDEFFETEFNMLDGVGANVGDGSRFTRIPRADLRGTGQWARHQPDRATGPNAVSCNACHIQLFDDGAGSAVANVHRDPLHTGELSQFIQRNTPHVFALGATQRLAEEMTTELFAVRDAVTERACSTGRASAPLQAKGVSFGVITATRTVGSRCRVTYDTTRVQGVASDLVVRPFQWKGNKATIRDFNRGAAHDELGMQAVELTGDGVDGDGDQVVDEVSVGDITALTVYLAAQPRPTTKLELASYHLIDPIPPEEQQRIQTGAQVFGTAGCAACHVPKMTLNDPIFSEPSLHPAYREDVFPAGQNAVARGVDPAHPVQFDLTRDQPDNRFTDDSGQEHHMGTFRRDANGRAVIELFGDMKHHDMGRGLAEPIDETGIGRSTFLTRNLWGVGSSAPYLHDGRATTLTEAVLEHGGEALQSRERFVRLSQGDQQALIAFLENLVLFKMEEGEVVVPPPPTVILNPVLRMRVQSRSRPAQR